MPIDRDPQAPTVYPGIRQNDSGADPSPAGLLKAMVIVVGCAAFGYMAVSAPTVAEAPAKAKEEKADTHAAGAPPAMPISVAVVPQMDITEYREYSGRLSAAEDAVIRPRVSGNIDSVHFKEGDTVQQGQMLFTIDLRPYQATYNTAEAAVAAAAAMARLAQSDFKRAGALLKERALSQREYDERRASLDNAQAALKAAEAQKELALLDLEYAQVKAPITGRVGRPEITVGNIVRANEDILTTIQSITPVYVDFSVDEGAYLDLMKSVRVEGKSGQMPVFMALADEKEFTREGRIRSFDNQLMDQSGTIRVRAEFDNPDGFLTPGLFARVRLGEAEKRSVVIINDAAISTDQSKRFVYVVGDDGTVQYREIVMGPLHPAGRVIDSGLQAGEKIIVNGLLRARPGMQVTPMTVDMTTLKPAGADAPPPAEMPAQQQQ